MITRLQPSSELLYAIAAHDTHKAYELIIQEKDIDTSNQDGITPLMVATYLGELDMVKALLKHGAYVNMEARTGKTALNFAIEFKKDDIAKLLRKAGAVYQKDNMLSFLDAGDHYTMRHQIEMITRKKPTKCPLPIKRQEKTYE